MDICYGHLGFLMYSTEHSRYASVGGIFVCVYVLIFIGGVIVLVGCLLEREYSGSLVVLCNTLCSFQQCGVFQQ